MAAKVFWPQKGPSSTVLLKKKEKVSHIFFFLFSEHKTETHDVVFGVLDVCASQLTAVLNPFTA